MQHEMICSICANRLSLHNLALKSTCVLCNAATWSNASVLPGQKVKLINNEGLVRASAPRRAAHRLQAMRCRSHNMRGYLDKGVAECYLCKKTTPEPSSFAALLCSGCALSYQQPKCCHTGGKETTVTW